MIESLCQQVDQLHKEKLYTNVTATFPDGEKTIQFRNETDRANLANVAQAAMALVMSGTPEAPMQYRTEDNVTQTVRADQMMGIAMSVLQQKEAILTAAWGHKDTLRGMTDYQEVIDYDITQGW